MEHAKITQIDRMAQDHRRLSNGCHHRRDDGEKLSWQQGASKGLLQKSSFLLQLEVL